jgi:dihydrofolate reductase
VVISNDLNFNPEGVVVCRSLEEGIKRANEMEKEEIFICGGGSIYDQTIDFADKLYLTIVEGDFDADTFFPDYSEFKNINEIGNDSEGKYNFKFLELTK